MLEKRGTFYCSAKTHYRKVQQHLTQIYRQRDPDGAKLLRNIRLAAQRHKQLKLTRDITGEYILFLPARQKAKEYNCVHRPAIFEFEIAAAHVFHAHLTVDQMVLVLLIELSGNETQAVEMALSDLEQTIRCFRHSIQLNERAYNEEAVYSHLNFDTPKRVKISWLKQAPAVTSSFCIQ